MSRLRPNRDYGPVTKTAALYYSIRSPYSYLGIMRLEQLLPSQPSAIDIELKPVMPIAVRKPKLFRKMNPLAIPYLWRAARDQA